MSDKSGIMSTGLRQSSRDQQRTPLSPLYSEAMADDSHNISLVSRWSNGECTVVAFKENIAFMAAGASLIAVDITDDHVPTVLGRLNLPSYVSDIALKGNYIYLAERYGGLRIVNIEDPAHPEQTCFTAIDSWIAALVADNQYVYLLDSISGLLVFDVSNPSWPREVGNLSSVRYCSDLSLSGTKLCLADEAYGLHIVDISNPAEPVETGLAYEGRSVSVVSQGDRAYVVREKLRILDISNPSDVHVVNESDHIAWCAYDIKLVEDLILVAYDHSWYGEDMGLAVFRRTAGDGLCLISNFDDSEIVYGARKIDYHDSKAFLACRNSGMKRSGLLSIDLVNPGSPVVAGFFSTGYTSAEVAVADHFVYLSEGVGGYWIIDTLDPAKPTEVYAYDPASYFAGNIALDQNYAYIVEYMDDGSCMLQVVDNSNPMQPVRRGRCGINSGVKSITILRSYLFLGITNGIYGGIEVIDCTDPDAPGLSNHYETDGVNDVAVVGTTAFLATTKGLEILDVSDPVNPVFVSRYDLPAYSYPFAIEVSGAFACIAALNHGLYILEISSAADPQYKRYFEIERDVYDVAPADGYALVANGNKGIRLINISDPEHPFETGFYDVPGLAFKVVFKTPYIYAVDNSYGLYILQPTISPAPGFTSIVPNILPDAGVRRDCRILGDHFQGDLKVQLNKTGCPLIEAANVTVISKHELRCDLDASGAEPGKWDVLVIDADGQTSGAVGAQKMTITADALTEIYLNPTPAASDSFGDDVAYDRGFVLTGAPAIAADHNGGFITVWREQDSSGDMMGQVYFRAFTAPANTWTEVTRVGWSKGMGSSQPDVAIDHMNNFIVLYPRPGTGSETGSMLFSQRYDASYQLVGYECRVDQGYTIGAHTQPAIAAMRNGDYVSVWQWNEWSSDGSYAGKIYANLRGRHCAE